MKLDRTKNALRNIVWGFLNKLITIVLPFINRTIMIYMMGDQYVGLGSLFASILSVLNLAELGIGSALVYNMYKPIADGDEDKICALMNFYRKCYRAIGLIVMVCGLVLMPFLQYLIKGSWPAEINIYLLYAMYLGQTVLSYNLFAYKNCLLGAHQRSDVTSKVNMAINIINLISQMLVLIFTRNYYIYVGIGMIFGILMNIVQAYYANKLFPQYKCRGELDKQTIDDLKKKVAGLVTSKIGGVVINSADNIVISAFLGLAVVGWYNNYYYIMSSIIGFLDIILWSLTAGIGNSVVTESVESNHRSFNKFNFIYQWITTWCAVCLLCLYQPTMSVWNPNGMFPFSIVCLLVFRFFAGRCVQMSFAYKDAMGLWWEDKWRPIISAVANLVINIILVNVIGIAGVIISTFVCTIFISTPWGNIVLFKNYFKKGLDKYFLNLGYCYIVTFIVCALTYFVCEAIPLQGVMSILVRAVICCIVPNILLVVFYFWKQEFKDSKQFALNILNKGLSKFKK